MDMIRTARRTRMRLWQNDERTTPVRWFRAAPGARVFEGSSRLRCSDWFMQQTWSGVGEVYPRVTGYDKGVNTLGYLGLDHCGPVEAMRDGGVVGVTPPITTRADGWSDCCGGPPFARRPARSVGRPAAIFPRGMTGRAVGRPVAVQGAPSAIQGETRGRGRPAGYQSAENGQRYPTPSLAVPVGELLAGVQLHALVDAVGRPIARFGLSNGQRSQARGVGRPVSWQGPRTLLSDPVSSIGRPIGVQLWAPTLATITGSIGRPAAAAAAGIITSTIMPSVGLPVGVQRGGSRTRGLVASVGLPVGVQAGGFVQAAGLAAGVGLPVGKQEGISGPDFKDGTTDGPSGPTIVIEKPPGVVAGDVLVIALGVAVSGFGGTIPPSGWTGVPIGVSFAGGLELYYRVCDGTEGSSFVWSSFGSVVMSSCCAHYGPGITHVGTGAGVSGTGSTAATPSYSVPVGPAIAVAAYGTVGANIGSGPAGWTLRLARAGSSPRAYIYDKTVAAGTVAPASASLAGSTAWGAGVVDVR